MTSFAATISLRVVLAWMAAASVLIGSGAAWVHWKQGEYLSEFISCCGPGESEWHKLIQPPFAVEDAFVGWPGPVRHLPCLSC